ncbi:MAG TPA: hypothetical protein PKY01_08785 [Candidatus Hydrogenedentes bacterium]|nr:hypothetical protein [Candidatus Hydrogenedentota bacterium]HQH52507.1 hypothetical protein [Candidatus Hydrogenedentota bacterium]HQM48481.1 hypothetical protein [Candidatus Hydrogenedentota bacterium]
MMRYALSLDDTLRAGLCAAAVLAAWCGCASVSYAADHAGASIGKEAQLFVDDVMLAHKDGVVRRSSACRKLEQPVLTADKPWERTDIDRRIYVYGTALPREDGTGCRMWYMGYPNLLLYATSDDGIHWERPNLGLVEFEGSKDNNLLDIKLHSPSIIHEADASDPRQRYKMLGYQKSGGDRGYWVAHSPDGLHWEFYDKNPVLPGGDTCTLAYDPDTRQYFAFHKLSHEYRGETRRLVYLAVSKDMQTWTEPELVMAPDEADDRQTRAEGGRCSHFYNMSAFRYGSQWLGLVTHFRYMGPPSVSGPEQSGQDGPIDVQLVHSRDGRHWNRSEDRSPVIPNGPYDYDAGCILGVANQPIVTGDEVWMYYSAITTTHGGYIPKKQISIARAAWRLDGWCSLHAGEAGGVIETVPLRPEGDRLTVNAAASGGAVAVAVLDASGNPVAGYGDPDCTPLKRDDVRQPVRWKNRDGLPLERPIRLRFRLRNADLFSYRIE